eukprot:523724-Pyramimonas_sp.AAC.1
MGWLNKVLTLNSGAFLASVKQLGGESNSPVAEWLNKGLMSVWSPNSPPLDACGLPPLEQEARYYVEERNTDWEGVVEKRNT